jgi:hypothetical protein
VVLLIKKEKNSKRGSKFGESDRERAELYASIINTVIQENKIAMIKERREL